MSSSFIVLLLCELQRTHSVTDSLVSTDDSINTLWNCNTITMENKCIYNNIGLNNILAHHYKLLDAFNDETNKYFDNYSNKKQDISLLNHYIEQAQNRIYESKNENNLIVNVYVNNVQNIRIVDIPGWIKPSTIIHQNDNDKRREIFYNNIIDIYNIIAFMISSLPDMNECNIFELLINRFKIEQGSCIALKLSDKNNKKWILKYSKKDI